MSTVYIYDGYADELFSPLSDIETARIKSDGGRRPGRVITATADPATVARWRAVLDQFDEVQEEIRKALHQQR